MKLDSEPIGMTTSDSVIPCFRTGIGMALMGASVANSNTEISIEICGRQFPAVIVKKPIYRKQEE
ncbi:MAG: Aminomethyltransferase [Verrucomicrobia subdivision 3 bacterium]|nr:Aminomethyltransferase [Limisphaerales bacterium]MCS1412536.1 Aminomethyltransferase [Limisphaerales bacterium]